MQLFSPQELVAVPTSIYADEAAQPDQVLAAVALSHLCEPGDMLLGKLAELLGQEWLLTALIERWDTGKISAALGSAVDELEGMFEQPLAKLWEAARERWLPRLNKSQVLDSVAWLSERKGKIFSWDCPGYPLGLKDLGYGKPPVLWLSGRAELLAEMPRIAVVGTRSSNRYGIQTTADIAAVAVQNQIVTVSGGAMGIDAVVHHSTLQLAGDTIAIMAGGLGNLYPRSNLELLKRVGESGLLLAEQPPAVTPSKWRFLMRNRLIAALGDATVIVQAGKTSGALNTGKHALDLMRPVAVVPGPVDSAFSVGCHDFLNNNLGNVQLLARASGLPNLMGLEPDDLPSIGGMGSLEKRALDTFSELPNESWQVQRLAGLTVSETQIALGALVLGGHLERVGSKFVRVSK